MAATLTPARELTEMNNDDLDVELEKLAAKEIENPKLVRAAQMERQATIAEDMPVEFLQCRIMGHAWELTFWGPANMLEDAGVAIPPITKLLRINKVRVSVCLRCSTIRDEFYPTSALDPWETWRVAERRYRYPEGYAFEKGNGPMDRRAVSRAAYGKLSKYH